MNLPQKSHERTVEVLLDAAGKVLEATYEDTGRTRQAIASLEHLRTSVEQRIDALSRDTVRLIEASSEQTAQQAAVLLQDKFLKADAVAEQACMRYAGAARGLSWRLAGLATLLQVAIFGTAWLVAGRTLPSDAEIASRRQVILELTEKIVDLQAQSAQLDRQIKTKQGKVNHLDHRGAKLIWQTCPDQERVNHPCIRTDERTEEVFGMDGETTYRIPWGY
jgi:hypothetical protein